MSAASAPALAPKPNGPTGPRTSAGKAASSRNSLRHGLTAREVVLPDEDPAAYEALLQDLLEAHHPAPGSETILLHQIAQGQWRLNRARRLELQALEQDLTAPVGEASQLDRILRYIAAIERELHRAIRDLNALQGSAARREAETMKAKAKLVAQEAALESVRSLNDFIRVPALPQSSLPKLQNELPQFISHGSKPVSLGNPNTPNYETNPAQAPNHR